MRLRTPFIKQWLEETRKYEVNIRKKTTYELSNKREIEKLKINLRLALDCLEKLVKE